MRNSLDVGNGNGSMAASNVSETSQPWGGSSFRITDIDGSTFSWNIINHIEPLMTYQSSWNGETENHVIQIPANSKIAYIDNPPAKIVCLRPTIWSASGILLSDNREAMVHDADYCGGNVSQMYAMASFDKDRWLEAMSWDPIYRDAFETDFSDCDFVLCFGVTG